MATPAFSATPQIDSMLSQPGAHPVRRRAMAVAAAMLCAPVVASAALAAIGATGTGDQPGMGSLAGTHGLRGSTVAATIPATPPTSGGETYGRGWKHHASPAAQARATDSPAAPPKATPAPSPKPGTHAPPQRAPSGPSRNALPKNSGAGSAPMYPADPSQPGAPVSSSYGGSSGSPTSGGTASNSTSPENHHSGSD